MVNWTQTPKVSLARVAFSGNYWDLIDRPQIGDGTLEIYQGETLKGRFTANQTTDTRIDLSTGTTSIDWGQIGGDIDDQLDLVAILDDKVDSSDLGSGTLSILANLSKTLGEFSANSQTNLNVDLSELYLAGKGISIATDYNARHDNNISVVIGQGTGLSFNRSGELEIDKVPVEHGGTGADTANGAEYNLFGTKASVGIGQIEDRSKIMFFNDTPSINDGTISGFGTPAGLWGYDKNKMHLERLLPETTGGGSITVHSAVPSEYTPVRYVTGSMSESVLDTGIPTVDSGLEIKVRWYQNELPNANNPLVVGVINGYGVGLSGGYRHSTITAMCNGTVVESDIIRVAGNTYEATMSLKSTVERGTITLTVYDITKGVYDTVSEEYLENVTGSLHDSGTMFLLGFEGVGYNTAGAAHIESVSIKQSGDLVLDYIPVMSSSDAYDTYGFWDTVTGTFCYAQRVSLLTGGGQAENNRSVVYYDDSGKADKTVPSASGNIATLDSTGNLLDSGYQISELGNIKPNWEAASGSDSEVLNKPNIKRGGSSGDASTAIVECDMSNNVATGAYSHAEGASNRATGARSHAEGSGTLAGGSSSHAEGVATTAYNESGHAEGNTTLAYGSSGSHAEGSGSKTAIQISGSGTTYTTSTEVKVGDIIMATINGSDKYVYVTAVSGTTATTSNTNLGTITDPVDAYVLRGVAFYPRCHSEGQDCNAIGTASHAEGYGTSTIAAYCHAEGYNTIASMAYSHAEGYGTVASDYYSHAEGYSTQASNQFAHAEGRLSVASGTCSHAEGRSATASGDFSHAEGYSTTAAGSYSHAEGRSSIAYNDYEHAEGAYNKSNNGSTDATKTRHSIGIGDSSERKNAVEVMANGNMYVYGVGDYYGTSISGKETLQEVISDISTNLITKADKTVPSASGNIATLDSTGNLLDSGYQISELGNIKPNWEAASGSDAEILNKPNIKRQGSSGNQASAIVEGDLGNNTAYGKFSHAEGSGTYVLSEGGHSEGKGTITESTFKISRKSGAIYVSDIDPTSEISEYSVIEYRSVAKYVSKIEFVDNEWQITLSTAFASPQPSNSTVNIHRGVSVGTGSHVEGQNCSVIRAYGHAEGLNCMAIGNGAHAEGSSTKATGDYSHSEGRDTSAIGSYSHSEGRYSESAANYAHSEGYNTFAIGVQSHAENRRTMARGLSSHAEGYCADTPSSFTVSATAGATTYTTNAAHNLVKRQRVAHNGIETYVSSIDSPTSFTVYETLNPDASLQGATIEVLSNHANSQGSHVEGSATVAANLYAHAEGEGTVAYNKAEHAEGRWNYSQEYSTQWPHPKNFLHTIGFGSGAGDRRNAVSVMQDGNVFINNVGGYDGTLNPGNSSKKSLQTVLSELEESDAYTVRCLVGTSGLIQNTLCAFDRNGSLHSIVTYDKDDNLTPSRSIEFVGNVYYYDGQDIAAGTDAYDLTLYKTFRHTDARKMLFGQTDAENEDQMGRITSTTYDGPSEMYISVSFGDCGWFLNPEIPSGRVNEEILFSRSNLGNVEDGAYIRLGCHNATDSTDEDWWSIQLESENGAYYYDSSLQYVKEYVNYQLGNIESLLSAI